MLKQIFLLSFLFTLSSVFAVDSTEVKLEKFTGITAIGNCKVTVKQGAELKAVVVNTDEAYDDDKIEIEVDGGELNIHLKGTNIKEKQIEIIVYSEKLVSATAKQGCWMVIEPVFKGEVIELRSTMGGKIKAEVDCERLKASVNNGGSVKITGKAEIAEMDISKGGTIGASFLEAEKVTCKIQAGGEIICNATKSLDMKITAGGNISYKGNPKDVNQKISMGGEIKKLE